MTVDPQLITRFDLVTKGNDRMGHRLTQSKQCKVRSTVLRNVEGISENSKV
ncbi:hypothetical protein HerbRD11066_08800 [Herbidospora sp. RD11066]